MDSNINEGEIKEVFKLRGGGVECPILGSLIDMVKVFISYITLISFTFKLFQGCKNLCFFIF